MYNLVPDYCEPLGARISKKWGRKSFTGILIERFDDGDEGELFRGIYTDRMVHDFSLDKTQDAVRNADPPAVSPDITLKITTLP